jgi:hypothetical protein
MFDILKNDKLMKEINETTMNPFNTSKSSYFHYLILCLNVLSKYSADYLEQWKKLEATNTLLKLVTSHPGIEFHIYSIITNICDDYQLEKLDEFKTIVLNYYVFIKRAAIDFMSNAIDRETRVLILNGQPVKTYTHTILIVKVSSSLGTVLNSLQKIIKNDKYKIIIYFEYKIKKDLKMIMLKGNDDEKILTIDLFIELSLNDKIAQDLSKDEEIKQFADSVNQNEKIQIKLAILKANILKKQSIELNQNSPYTVNSEIVLGKIEGMNEIECKMWFESKKIDPLILASLGGSCNGKVLEQIWHIKKSDPQFFHQSLKNSNVNEQSIALYSAALEDLFKI